MIRIICIVVSGLFLNAAVYAQEWLWGKGSIGNNVKSWPVATDQLGNVYVAGVSAGAVSFDNNSLPFAVNGNLCVVAKYDGQGDFLWARSMDNGTNTFPIAIATDTSGNCYLFGWLIDSSMGIGGFTLHNTAYPGAQYFIAKFDPRGNVLWASNGGGRTGALTAPPVSFNSACSAQIPGLGGIAVDTGGNIYITTAFNLPTVTVGTNTLTNKDASGTTDDILLVKYDTSGSVVWAKSPGGIGTDIPCGITVTRAGDIYIAGFFNSDSVIFGPSVIKDVSIASQQWNAFIARYDGAGNPVWASGSGGGGKTYASGITSDTNNTAYMVGGTADSVISFGGLIIINPNPGSPILYLVSFDTSNNPYWYKIIASPTGGNAWGYSVAMSPMGQVWVSGAFSDEVNIGGHILDTPGLSVDPVFIAGFGTTGYYVASGALQSGSDHQAGIACDANGDIYLCSDYKYPCYPFIIANDVLANVSTDETWLYLAKYSFSSSIGPGSGPSTINGRKDTVICINDNDIILAGPPGYTLYRWNDGSSDTALRISSAGAYWVKAMGNNDIAFTDTIVVKIDSQLCNCEAVLPNAFTPNGDGKNDTYGPIFGNGCSITKYAFSIYNRWGQCVFYTTDPYAKWDGTFENALADMDVYMFYLIYQPNPKYPEHVKKGDLTLIR